MAAIHAWSDCIAMNRTVVFTIGHSNRSIDEFIDMLTHFGVDTVVDVRTIPRSRANPQFNGDGLGAKLAAHGIGYVHMAELGGLRHARAGSKNTAWRNASFRGFADYMQTNEFRKGVTRLAGLARRSSTVVMCAEALPWRCHRSLIADALVVRGMSVIHITGRSSQRTHTITPWAVVSGTRITYPG